jgi:hypothetical protein
MISISPILMAASSCAGAVAGLAPDANSASAQKFPRSMIRKSGHRFSEKITLKQQAKAEIPNNVKSFRFSHRGYSGSGTSTMMPVLSGFRSSDGSRARSGGACSPRQRIRVSAASASVTSCA